MKNVFSANEKNIKMIWGVAPLPPNFIPVLVNIKISSRNYGLLMYNTKTKRWAVGAGNIMHNIAPSEAERLIGQVDTATEHGGKREGSGRKKQLPEGAKCRSILLTDEEYLAIKKIVNEMRNN